MIRFKSDSYQMSLCPAACGRWGHRLRRIAPVGVHQPEKKT